MTDFLTGVLSALILYFVLRPFLEPSAGPAVAEPAPVKAAVPSPLASPTYHAE